MPPHTTPSCYQVNIADNSLVAPRDGRIQYRIANVGEVLPAGGKVFTMLDIGYVYMDVYLPTLEAGQVKLGTDARIVLDAYPDHRDPGQGVVRRHAGAVHAQDRRDQERARQADVPDPGADRSRAAAHARRGGAQRPARARLRQDRSRRWPGRTQLQGDPPTMTGAAIGRARSTRSRSATARRRARRTSRSRFPAGCMVGLIGPDGVGKSTLLEPYRRRPADPVRHASTCLAATWPTRAPRRCLPAHRLHAARSGQEPLSRPQRAGEHRVLRPAVRTVARGTAMAHRRIAGEHRTRRRSPTGPPRNCPAACGRSSACAAR